MRLKIASRSSDLARIQAFQVARALKSVLPDLKAEFEFRASLGDQNLDVPLSGLDSKGVFTQDFFEDLKNGKFDLVVHSWKDLPTEPRVGTHIAATLRRADVRDLLLVPKATWDRAARAGVLKLLSSSPRRSYNLSQFQEFLPVSNLKLEFQNVRGNVPTRIGKMFSEDSGLILAKAALDRLLSAPEDEFEPLQSKLREQLSACRFMVLPVSLNPPAAAQGALAIEVADGRTDLTALLNRVNDSETFAAVEEERRVLTGYGGGCHQKIGVAVLSKPFGTWKCLRGLTESGLELDQNDLECVRGIPPTYDANAVFPLKPSDNSWFERERLPVAEFNSDAAWVARADAWPEEFKFDGFVWTSGLESWKKLAARSVWVNGCAEGLGDEDPGLSDLLPHLAWTKLTHADASKAKNQSVLATYRLTPKAASRSPSLKGKTHFFWMSGSSYRRARELFPDEVSRGYHGCGPGQTLSFLKSESLQNPPQVFLSLEAFLRHILPS